MAFGPPPRRLQPELMDEPDLDQEQHRIALTALARINRWSASSNILWTPLRKLAQEVDHPLRILDVATGSGDVLRELHRRAQRAGISLSLQGCDLSETALSHARSCAEKEKAPIRFFRCDALTEDLGQDYDAVTSSLFLHHLTEEQADTLLRQMKSATTRLVVINDLQRCRVGVWLAYLASRALTRSHVVHVDAVRSVQGAFTISEVRQLAEKAGLSNAQITRHFPWRYRLVWDRKK